MNGRIHPAFRILALATPSPPKGWLSNEVLQLFHFFHQDGLADLSPVLAAVALEAPALRARLLALRRHLAEAALDRGSPLYCDGPAVCTLSLRGMLRCLRLGGGLRAALMVDLMPPPVAAEVTRLLSLTGFEEKGGTEVRIQEAVPGNHFRGALELAPRTLTVRSRCCASAARAPG